uniref:SFRICE_029495 n=1 Tax=Spodoptera frugiperda TaxID=7108 RepID=A0A2H1WAH2_SPOFR
MKLFNLLVLVLAVVAMLMGGASAHPKRPKVIVLNHHGTQEHTLTYVNNTLNTRSMAAGRFNVPRVTNYYGDRTLNKRIPYLLNNLPADIRSEAKLNRFKHCSCSQQFFMVLSNDDTLNNKSGVGVTGAVGTAHQIYAQYKADQTIHRKG